MLASLGLSSMRAWTAVMARGACQPRAIHCPWTARPSAFLHVRKLRWTLPVEMGRRSDKIAGKKGKEDAKRAKVYGKFGKQIAQVAKAGGADPVANVRLAEIMKIAKDAGVPKEIIDRNIKNAADKNAADFTEVTYEAYGPGGTGFIVECLTDNVNRSASEVKSTIGKCGCKVAEPGSVLFNFQRVGQIVLAGTSEDALFEAAMEAGCDDFVPIMDEDGEPSNDFKVFSPIESFAQAQKALAAAKIGTIEADSTGLVYRALSVVKVEEDAFKQCELLIEKLLDLDDVDAVYTNCEGLNT